MRPFFLSCITRSLVLNPTLGTVRKNDEGWPWAMLWNVVMDRCAGFPPDKSAVDLEEDGRRGTLPCHPMTVIYGHAASRGLSIARWTKGLDSGCVRALSFLLSRWSHFRRIVFLGIWPQTKRTRHHPILLRPLLDRKKILGRGFRVHGSAFWRCGRLDGASACRQHRM